MGYKKKKSYLNLSLGFYKFLLLRFDLLMEGFFFYFLMNINRGIRGKSIDESNLNLF